MKPKTYEFKGKRVIAVPETNWCDGCVFLKKRYKGYEHCKMMNKFGDAQITQKKYGFPDCEEKEIIFQLAPDEKA